jgi:hypothetical protein
MDVREKVPPVVLLSTAGRGATHGDKFIGPPPGASVQERPPSRFRQVLFRVMTVQLISLAVLWWLQARYGR